MMGKTKVKHDEKSKLFENIDLPERLSDLSVTSIEYKIREVIIYNEMNNEHAFMKDRRVVL